MIYVLVKATKEKGHILGEYPDSGSVTVRFMDQRTRQYDVSDLRYWGEPGVDAPHIGDYHD
jgi:hypothetical protein